MPLPVSGKVLDKHAASSSEEFFQISLQTQDLSSIEYIKKLLEKLSAFMGMEYVSIYELMREGQYSLVNLVDAGIGVDQLNINDLDHSSLDYLLQETCFVTSEIMSDRHQNIRKAVGSVKTLVTLCIPDSRQKTIGLMLLASASAKMVDQEQLQLLKLFRSRLGAELERFRLQFALEYSKDQSRYITEHSRDMIWNIDTDGFYTYVNPACYEIYGYNPDEMIGKHYSEFIHRNMINEFDVLIENNKKDEEVHKLITQHQSRNGFPVKLICTTRSLRDKNGVITGIAGTSTDITEFIRSQILNKNNNELFSKVLSRLPVIFFRVNEDGQIIDIRGKGLRRLNVEDMDWVDKSSYGLFRNRDKEINAVLNGETASFEISGTAGGEFWSFFVSMFFDSWTGFGAIGFCVDITEQRLNEDKLEKLLSEKRELNQQLVKIQEEERRSLARELHDEFGQSITAVKSLAKAITGIGDDQYSETRSLSNSIVDLSAKLYEVVNDMMRRLRPEILDTLGLEAALKNCVERSQLELEGINCNLTLTGELSTLDEVVNITIYRIVQECLTNISKYAMASNVDVAISRETIKSHERRQRFDYLHQDDKDISDIKIDLLTICIKDDGVGMDVKEAMKKKEHRNRMGLKGIEERVTALDGHLDVISEPYKGVKIVAQIDVVTSGDENKPYSRKKT